MQWEVTGADRDSGADRTITLDAADEAQARHRAGRQGLLVASLRRLPDGDRRDMFVTPSPPPTIPMPDAAPPPLEYRSAPSPLEPGHGVGPGSTPATLSWARTVLSGVATVVKMLVLAVLLVNAAGLVLHGWLGGAGMFDVDTAVFDGEFAPGATANRTRDLVLAVRDLQDTASVIAGILCAILAVLLYRPLGGASSSERRPNGGT